MPRKKTVSQAVVLANRANSKSSTGPTSERGKSTSSRNATRHGILARAVFLDTDEKCAEYHAHWQFWNAYFNPQGPLEQLLVEDLTNISWKLAIEEALETKELARRKYVSDCGDGVFNNSLTLPIDAGDLPLDQTWGCEKFVVRAVAAEDRASSSGSRKPGYINNQWVTAIRELNNQTYSKGSQLEVQAVLGSSIDTLVRYRAGLKHDMYRAIDALRSVQEERRGKTRNVFGAAVKG